MTSWFRRLRDDTPASPPPGAEPDAADQPDALLAKNAELIEFINASAGRLPTDATVAARRITDTVCTVIATSGERELSIYTVISIRGVLDDYLPTTLRNYLALDAATVEVPRPSGGAPREALLDQLTTLHRSVDDLLAAVRAQDADAMMAQGKFLRTKFSGSDLDL